MSHFAIHTVTSAALSFLKHAEWVAVVTVFATTAASWVEFTGFVQKLDSCANTVRALETHLSWWRSLSDGAKAGTAANDRLVKMGEQCILAIRFSRNLVYTETRAQNLDDVQEEAAAESKKREIEAAANACVGNYAVQAAARQAAAALGLLKLLEALSLDAGTLCAATAAAVAYCNDQGVNSVAALGARASRLIAHPKAVLSPWKLVHVALS
eukprot:scaffold58322_cov67-Phaeocystis_antarctica.AAC.12